MFFLKSEKNVKYVFLNTGPTLEVHNASFIAEWSF